MSNPSQQPPNTLTGASGTGGVTNQGGDLLDKGVDFITRKAGHAQSAGTVEKISDGIRSIFKKITGKDIPIKDDK